MQMMTGSSCLSMYGILCAKVLRMSPQLTRIQILNEIVQLQTVDLHVLKFANVISSLQAV